MHIILLIGFWCDLLYPLDFNFGIVINLNPPCSFPAIITGLNEFLWLGLSEIVAHVTLTSGLLIFNLGSNLFVILNLFNKSNIIISPISLITINSLNLLKIFNSSCIIGLLVTFILLSYLKLNWFKSTSNMCIAPSPDDTNIYCSYLLRLIKG